MSGMGRTNYIKNKRKNISLGGQSQNLELEALDLEMVDLQYNS